MQDKCLKLRRFYINNKDIFVKYFANSSQYESLINEDKFNDLGNIINKHSEFDFLSFKESFYNNYQK